MLDAASLTTAPSSSSPPEEIPKLTRQPPSIHSDSSHDSCLEEDEEEFPSLDPRHLNAVHEELEKLNIATDVINKLELQLDGARAAFREIQGSWSEKLKELSKKYGSAINKARPYYEAKLQERRLREESQRAAIRFERASNLLGVAKQQVSLTQDSLNRQTAVHPECLEVLNHHIQRVSEAEAERAAAEAAHRTLAERMHTLAGQILSMEKEHRSAIKKSRTYFDQRLEFSRVLEHQKALILRLEAEVRQKKSDYTTSLRNLEKISDSIHEQRSVGGLSSRSSEGSARKDIGSARGAPSEPAGPPPYRPTAPPAYDAHNFDEDGRYAIPTPDEGDESLAPVLSMISEETASDWEERTRKSLGSGVILLAQQLMGGKHANVGEKKDYDIVEQTDVSYRTSIPEGLPSSGDSSEVSSLASGRTGNLTDDEKIIGMMRSHSALIQEIDDSVDRLSTLFKRSVSDAADSGVEGVSAR